MFQPYLSPLSPRETEVIELIAEGLTDKEIAVRLGITPRTVIEHLVNIRNKLGASNRAAAVYRYFYSLIGQRARLIESRHLPPENAMTQQTNYTLRLPNPDKDIPALVPSAYQFYMATWSGFDTFLGSPTEQMMAEDFRQDMGNAKHRWRVAEDAHGNVLGYSKMHCEPWDPGHILTLTVKPEARSQGVGTALFDDALKVAQEAGAKGLYAVASEQNPSAMRFALKRGFTQTEQRLVFELDLARFDEGRFGHVIGFSKQANVRMASLAEFENSEDARHKLFQLNAWVNMLDLPGHTDKPAWDSFEQFNEAVCNASWYQPEGQIVAIDEKTGEWIGIAATTVNALGASNVYTGVDRRYRHNPIIGQTLMFSSIQYAKRSGCALFRYHCASLNATNLAICFVLGFQIKFSLMFLEKKLH